MENNYQCCLCGHYFENESARPEKCPECNCPQIREVQKGTMDAVTAEAVAHLRKKVDNCPNYDVDPRTGRQSYHKLQLEREIDFTGANIRRPLDVASVTIRERCRSCHQLYGQRVVPLSRRDILENLGILDEVEAKVRGYAAAYKRYQQEIEQPSPAI